MFIKKHFLDGNNQSGQAILIVVLVMVVALTVGLSIATRTITNLRNTQDQSNSQKALSAAEAGVEQAIKNQVNIGSQSLGNNAKYVTTVTSVLGTQFVLNGGSPLTKDEGGFVWLDTPPTWASPWAPSGATITFYWGDTTDACSNAALELAVISGNNPATSTVKRYALDPCTTRGNQFITDPSVTTGNYSIAGGTFHNSYQISVTKGFLIKVLPIYSNTNVAVVGSIALPKQGSVITSTGTSDTATRIVNVYAGYPEVPTELFPFNLFSP